MPDEFCFGKIYSSSATECQACDVREECKMATQDQGEVRLEMPCWGKFKEANYACKKACYVRDDCARYTAGGSISVVEESPHEETIEVTTEVTTAVEVMAEVESPTEIDMVVSEAEPSEPESVGEAEISVEVETLSVDPIDTILKTIEGKPTKKGIVRQAVKIMRDGISSDTIVELMVTAGVIIDSPAELKKAKEYVSLCISELRKLENMTIVNTGGKYALL